MGQNNQRFSRTAGAKIVSVTDKLGIKGMQNMQGTTRIIYDSVPLASSASKTDLKFFENVNTRQFPLTNLTENKLQVGETIAMQRFSFMIVAIETVGGIPNGKVTDVQTLASINEFKPMYRSDLSFSISQDQVIKKLPLHSMYSPFNKDSRFNGSQTFGAGGNTSSFEISHDVFHFDNPIVIPPQIEFTGTLTIPPITLPVTPNRAWYMVMTLEGLGSLFAPKSNY